MKRTLFTVRAVAWTLSFCLILGSVSLTPFTSIATTTPGPMIEDESLEDGARQFDEGVRDVATILNLDLSTEKGVRQAAEIFKRNEKKLANFEKKALQAAARVASFQKGLKDEASKRKGGEAELATELESNPGAVGNIPGAAEAAEAIKQSTKSAAETFQRLAEALKKAGEAKKKHAHANSHRTKSTISETGPSAGADPSSNINPQSFCGSYQYICDILTRAALYRLRNALTAIRVGTRKANCVLSAYSIYTSCVNSSEWWEQALCLSRLSTNINFCLTYA